ncbi:hypothetical protein [Arthrobacter sp. SLBN-100]|nr:hypothetical protein [Arthrobacter sp. SLBN-100]
MSAGNMSSIGRITARHSGVLSIARAARAASSIKGGSASGTL